MAEEFTPTGRTVKKALDFPRDYHFPRSKYVVHGTITGRLSAMDFAEAERRVLAQLTEKDKDHG